MRRETVRRVSGLVGTTFGRGARQQDWSSPLYRTKLLLLTAILLFAMTGIAVAALSTYWHGSSWENGWYSSSGSSTIKGGWMENEDWDLYDTIRQETVSANPPFQTYAWAEASQYLNWTHSSQSNAKSRCKWWNPYDSGYEPLWCKKRT